jgi:hypothetical protein
MRIAKYSDFDYEIAVVQTFEDLKILEGKAAAVIF